VWTAKWSLQNIEELSKFIFFEVRLIKLRSLHNRTTYNSFGKYCGKRILTNSMEQEALL
jgi:hypothetical protein